MPRSSKKPTNPTAPNAGQSAAPIVPPKAQPITVPTGLPYGEAKALADAQRSVPVAGQPGVAGGGGPGPAGGQPGGIDQAVQAAQGFQFNPIGLGQPTTRPNEPVTAGVRSGPGPGPAALTPPPPSGGDPVGAYLNRLASAPGVSSDVQALLTRAKAAGSA